MTNQISGGPHNHRVRVEVFEGGLTFETPGQDNGKGHFIQLNSLPIGLAVNPEVLRETSVVLLGDVEVNQGSQGCGMVSGCQHRSSTVDHVARPNQVVT